MKIIKTASGKQTIKMSKKEWESIGKKAKWTIAQTETKIIQTPDRIENLRNIANFMVDNCPRDTKLMNTLWGYGQQLLIIADELENKLRSFK